MMKDTLGKYQEKTQSIGASLDKVDSIGIPEALNLVGIPTVSKNAIGKTQVDSPLSTRFTVFALAFNAFGLATLTFGGISIGGNVLAADAVLGSSLVCLSAFLIRSLGSMGKRNLRLMVKQKISQF